jgi:hypothetical protein
MDDFVMTKPNFNFLQNFLNGTKTNKKEKNLPSWKNTTTTTTTTTRTNFFILSAEKYVQINDDNHLYQIKDCTA